MAPRDSMQPADGGPAGADPTAALARERTWNVRVGPAAVLAGVLLLAGGIVSRVAIGDAPEVTLLDAFKDAAGQPPPSGGLRTETALYYHDKMLPLTLGQVALGIGGLLAALVLVHLFLATRARRPQLGQAALAVAMAGGVAFLVGSIVPQVARMVSLADFADAAKRSTSAASTSAAHDALQPAAYTAGVVIQYVGYFALAVGFLMVCLNAMKVGLLTRFMGVLGCLSGVLFVFQLGSMPAIQAFWLAGLGLMLLGLWPGPVPSAWETGRAEPWPSRQQLLEARTAATGASAEDDEPSAPAHPRSKKKRRRRS